MVQENSDRKQTAASMYSSPGPEYKLPTLLGEKGHDTSSSYRKYPAYSFGIRHGKLKDTLGPGPCHFINPRILRDGVQESPQFSIYGRRKEIIGCIVPGPGAPPSEKTIAAIYPSTLTYSFGTRHQPNRTDRVPAANCYKADRITVKSSKFEAPSYTIKGLLNLDKIAANARKTPGPAQYTMTDPAVYKGRAPQYSITSRNYMPGNVTSVPGPGTHKVCRANSEKSTPSYSFGIKHSDRMTPLIVDFPDIECDPCS